MHDYDDTQTNHRTGTRAGVETNTDDCSRDETVYIVAMVGEARRAGSPGGGNCGSSEAAAISR